MKKAGFTLVELSVVLVIIALVIGMTISSGVTVISAARYSATISKMNALDQALMSFRIANDRLPCPADLSQTQGSATYGTEGNCTAIAGGVFVAQNASATATAAEGGIPTSALGLPGDFMYDGWGNRFRYAVDTRMTSTGAFSLMQIGCVNGAITVYGGPNYPATSNTARTTGAVYALISNGANGHGGVTKNATVYDAGSLNSDELTNCHCTSTGGPGTYTPTYVQLAPYTYQAIGQANSLYNFDDLVSYKERWQMQTTWDKVGTSCAGGEFSRAITINYPYVSTVNHTNLTDFPMLFSGTYSYLAMTANGGSVANGNGYDITFTSDAAGNDLLPFERESYNAATGQVVFWIQVPTVSATANTTIYLWYGNPNITTDQSNANGTWDSNYKTVYHLKEDPTGAGQQIKDSTANGNNATTAGTWISGQQTTGEIGGSLNFKSASSDKATAGNIPSADNSSYLTIEGWFNATTLATDWAGQVYARSDGTHEYALETSAASSDCNSRTAWEFIINNGSGNFACTAGGVATTGTWQFVAGVFDGKQSTNATKNTLYINGVAQPLTFYLTTPATTASASQPLQLGYSAGSGNYYNGLMDEIRISNIARSADWIVTEYNNQSSPGTFYTVGSAVSR